MKTQEGIVTARYGKHIEVETPAHTLYTGHIRFKAREVGVGDCVFFEADAAHDSIVITEVKPRRSILSRLHAYRGERLIASNIDVLAIVIAPIPHRSINVLDRYLFLAQSQGIPAFIIYNKADLLNEEERAALSDFFAFYATMGHALYYVSTKTGEGMEALNNTLLQRSTAFCGLSGVGKSSLLQALLPHLTLKIGDLSAKTGEGNHTTTTARLYHLNDESQVIDCPGIRELSFEAMPLSQLLKGFPDIALYANDCYFRDCQHTGEKGCVLIDAVNAGKILPHRFQSFQSLRGISEG
jgi:ribosome biogenesis GTPase